jgi:hypothetical protein
MMFPSSYKGLYSKMNREASLKQPHETETNMLADTAQLSCPTAVHLKGLEIAMWPDRSIS